jgi:predicted enzyme related to lactoylglutathione lyase
MVFWVTAFLDFPADDVDSELAFWSDVTGYAVSPVRGDKGEFATLMPPDGDAFLRVQRLADGPSRIHLDLHVEDPPTAAHRAAELGANVVGHPHPGHVAVLTSPGGFTFCFVREPAAVRPLPAIWVGDSWSILDQVCLDIPADRYETECAFWSALTGWELRRSPVAEEFGFVVRPREIPIRILLQRLGDQDGRVRAHPDLACSDRPTETDRHLGLGAELVQVYERWTVLRSPAGSAYCLTDRNPKTGLLD